MEKNMNRSELVAAVAEKSGLTKKDAEKAVVAAFEIVKEAVAGGKKVQISAFGTFEARERKARIGKNPRSGEEVKIPASVVPGFKAGKGFKDAVNKK